MENFFGYLEEYSSGCEIFTQDSLPQTILLAVFCGKIIMNYSKKPNEEKYPLGSNRIHDAIMKCLPPGKPEKQIVDISIVLRRTDKELMSPADCVSYLQKLQFTEGEINHKKGITGI